MRGNLHFDRYLFPGFMPDPEEAPSAPVQGERGVALEEKFGERSGFARMEIFAGWTRAITQQIVVGLHSPSHDAVAIRVIVGDAAKSVRQPE